MFYLLELREKIKKFYQEKETIAVAIFKFVISFVVFYTITHNLNYSSLLSNILVIVMLSVIGAFIPSTVLTFLAMIVTSLEVFYYSSVLGAVVVTVLLILYCLFIRFTPKLGIVVLAIPIAFILKIPCFIPIVLGLIYTPVSVVAIGCGTILYYLLDAVRNVHKSVGTNVVDGGKIYEYLINQFKDNTVMIFTIIVFIAITLIVYVIRTREINHAFEVAILTGTIVNLLAFLTANLLNDIKIPVNILELILGTIGAGLLAFIVQNFKCALDYSTVEKVQFEDDDYYYYVKAIPKIKVIEKKSDIKKIAVQKPVGHKLSDKLNSNREKNVDEEKDFNKNFDEMFDKDFDKNFSEGFDLDYDRISSKKEDISLEKKLSEEVKSEEGKSEESFFKGELSEDEFLENEFLGNDTFNDNEKGARKEIKDKTDKKNKRELKDKTDKTDKKNTTDNKDNKDNKEIEEQKDNKDSEE